MLFAMTGVTGLMGRNLFLEIIKQNRKKISDIKFIFFGRDSKEESLKERVIEILEEDLKDYLSDDSFDFNSIYPWFESNVKLINYKLDVEGLNLSEADLTYLKNQKIDFFYHIAALTNLWHDEDSRIKLESNNVDGTRYVIDLVKQIKSVGEFSYVGTAYCCGHNFGKIQPDFLNLHGTFRNNYERTKMEAEILVRNFEKESGQKCRYFRPSIVCGRMTENKLGAVSKFDVFYGWGAFFLQLKSKLVSNIENIITEKVHIDLRYQISFSSGLNVVPVDYCAKVMYHACVDNHPEKHIYLTYHKEIPHTFYFPLILKSLNIEGPTAVDYYPEDQNRNEKLYYKSAGKVYNSYITAEPMLFQNGNIDDLAEKHGLKNPDLALAHNFQIFLDYANEKKYGMF